MEGKARNFIEKHKYLAESSETCCIHFDVRPENIIVEDGEIKAVIDWEKAISLAPEWDLQYSMILSIHSKIQKDSTREEMMKHFFQAYLEERELEENWRKRLLYFNTIWMLKGMAKFEKDFPEERKEEIEKEWRNTFNQRYEDLEKAAKKQLPEDLTPEGP